MKNRESLLVITTFIFMTLLYVLIKLKAPRVSLIGKVEKGAYFDKRHFPQYFKFLVYVVLASAIFGYLFVQSLGLTLQYLALNLGIGIVFGGYLILYRRHEGHDDIKK